MVIYFEFDRLWFDRKQYNKIKIDINSNNIFK